MGERLRHGALLIAGPTASGKTALALNLAGRLNGAVINADAMQVYRDLRIITARPTPEEEAAVPHFLFGFVDAARNYSLGLWLADVAAAIEDARSQGKLPILVGGSGLYFKGLIRGLADMPAVDPAIRAQIRHEAIGRPTASLHARLAASDPRTAARLRPSDRQRILRALEVFAATGRPLAEFQEGAAAPLLAPGFWTGVFLAPDRAALRQRIEARFDQMIEAGALDEVARLASRGLDPDLPAMRAHGVPGLIAHLRGQTSLEEAVARGKSDTRRYVKRQFTFARHQLPEFRLFEPEQAADSILRELDACADREASEPQEAS